MHHKSGNSLLELLIAITVFSLFVVALLTSISSLGFVQIKSNYTLTASQLAREAIESAVNWSLNNWSHFSSLNGEYFLTYQDDLGNDLGYVDFSVQNPGPILDRFNRRIVIQPAYRDNQGNIAESGNIDPNTIKVSAIVEWQSADQPNQVVFTTYLINQNFTQK